MVLPFQRKKKRVGPDFYYGIGYSDSRGPSGPEKQEAYRSFADLEQTKTEFDRIEFLDTKRAEIALKFVKWYLFLILVIIIGVPIFNAAIGNNDPLDIYKLLGQLGTLLGSPLGFVVGYYFKDDKSN